MAHTNGSVETLLTAILKRGYHGTYHHMSVKPSPSRYKHGTSSFGRHNDIADTADR